MSVHPTLQKLPGPAETTKTWAAAIGLGGPINYISAEEGAAGDRAPADPGRAWELWKKKAVVAQKGGVS